MTRVAATIMHSPYASSYASEIEDLRSWTNEILVAAFSRLVRRLLSAFLYPY